MSESIDWPQRSQLPRRRNYGILILLALLAVIFLGGRTILSYWVDLLWFRSLGYGTVFLRTLILQWGFFAAFAVATFVILYGTFALLKRVHRNELPLDHTIIFAGRDVNLSVKPVLRILSLGVSLVIAVVSGTAMAAQWATFSLYWFAPHATSSMVDPIFGKPLNFFLFSLPAWDLLIGWLLTLAVVACLFAAMFLLLTGSSRAFGGRMHYAPLSWQGLSITLAFLFLVLALREYLDRFEQLFEHHTIFDGINYTDAHVMLTGMLLISAALMLGAVMAAANAVRKPGGRWLLAAALPVAVCYVAVSLTSWYVSNFLVKPNQLVRERPYIVNNIEMTRQAFGLDSFVQHEFPADTSVAAVDQANNQVTLQNIRLWDWRALQDTLRQIQEIRTYYDFPDIDIDRYNIQEAPREVMIAARELNVDKLPESSRNWINDKLIYTHGYGVTMNPVNGFTPEGLPDLILSNMPVESTVPSLKVTRPEIYFGELTDTDVYVKTKQQEFNYPHGQDNNLTSYQGTGGIEIGGFLRRILLAFDRGDLTKLPFSDDVTPGSRLLMRRNVRARVAALAPFLTFERDPYVVVGDDGRLLWIIDAFTTSDNYPYASHYQFGNGTVNYMRNSVKVVIDAYNGTTTFYDFDPKDPIIAGYRRIFPSLFKDASEMPAGLRKHVRYPESLLTLQAAVYGLYHMIDPEVFYNREDLWTVASEVGMADGGDQTTESMQPNYVLMKLPGESSEEFVEILPFTPVSRNNLIGWIAGRCDGVHYGTAVVYDFPKTKLVDGPLQIEARIDQNAQISGQLTLWNQQGSHVRRGSLLVIPSGRALLYAEPIYLQAERSPMPELRLVVLALQDKLAYGPTYEAALSSLFGGGTSSLNAAETPQATAESGPGTESTGATNVHGMIAKAAKDLEDYQQLTAAGKLGEAGQKLEELKTLISRLNSLQR
jgi:uncharacterized protein